MPYLKIADKVRWDPALNPLLGELEYSPATPGELNFIFTETALAYLHGKVTNYATLAEVIGAFEAAKLEFYRRRVVPYEDKKIAENGDVYP